MADAGATATAIVTARAAGRLGLSLAATAALAAVLAAADAIPVVVSRDAFRPDTLRVRRGDTLRLEVSSGDDEHCFAVDELRVEKRVRPGKPVVVELTPDRAGTFAVYCCLEDEGKGPRARLIVSD